MLVIHRRQPVWRRTLTGLAAAGVLLAATGADAQPQRSADALLVWVTAVREHQPGKADAPAGIVAGLSYGDRVRLNPAMQLFLNAVRGQPVVTKSESARQIMELFRSVRRDPGLAPFLRRAAVLHTDAAVFAAEF